MVKFELLWSNLVGYLKSKAAELGVSDTAIVKGAPGKMPPPAPFLYVLCMPGEGDEDDAGNLNYALAEITIFCGAEPETDEENSIIKAVQLAGRVRTTLIDTDYCADGASPEFVEKSSNYTVVSFEFSSLFDPYEDLISE